MPAQEPFFISQQSGDTLTPLPEAMPDLPTTAVADALASVSRAARNARIAVYDDMLSEPRVVGIVYTDPLDYIEKITNEAYSRAKALGGSIPYTVIRELVENFIHAGFKECCVSVYDFGNTISFSDQGPGIVRKDQVLKPGFTSATAEMKRFIRGVGSGLPRVNEYLQVKQGRLSIEDNAVDGAVVTISMYYQQPGQPYQARHASEAATPETNQVGSWTPFTLPRPPLSQPDPASQDTAISQSPPQGQPFKPSRPLKARETKTLDLLYQEGILGANDLAQLLDISAPTATRILQQLEQLEMVEVTAGRKKILSNNGMSYLQAEQANNGDN